MTEFNYDKLEEELARKTSLEPYEISRVLMMVRQRCEMGWDDRAYVLHSSLNDSGADSDEIESFMTVYFGDS